MGQLRFDHVEFDEEGSEIVAKSPGRHGVLNAAHDEWRGWIDERRGGSRRLLVERLDCDHVLDGEDESLQHNVLLVLDDDHDLFDITLAHAVGQGITGVAGGGLTRSISSPMALTAPEM